MKTVCAVTCCKYSLENCEVPNNVFFVSFPNNEMSFLWAFNCGRSDLLEKSSSDLSSNYFVCTDHIEEKYFISRENPITVTGDIVPTIFEDTRSAYEQSQGLANTCRICGDSENLTTDFDGLQEEQVQMREKINLVLPISVQHGDQLSKKLCSFCCKNIRNFYDLVEISLKNDIKWKKLLNVTKNFESSYDARYSSLVRSCLAKDDYTDKNLTPPDSEPSFELDDDVLIAKTHDIEDYLNEILPLSVNETETSIVINFDDSLLDDDTLDLALQDTPPPSANNSPMTSNDLDPNDKVFQDCMVQLSNFLVDPEESLNYYVIEKKNSTDLVTRGKLDCHHCNAWFVSKRQMRAHLKEAHDTRLFWCGYCQKGFAQKKHLLAHVVTHGRKSYLCEQCGKNFCNTSNLKSHMKSHLSIDQKNRYVCDLCHKTFRFRFGLTEHMNKHQGRKPYKCKQCGKEFHQRIQFNQHKLVHENRVFACPICDVTFNRKGNMQVHLKRHETSDGTYECRVCGLRYETMSELKHHRKTHTEDEILLRTQSQSKNGEIWRCEVCTKVFLTKQELQMHKKCHNQNKPQLECEDCGRKFVTRGSLTYHRKSSHLNVRPYKCQYCGKDFVSKQSCELHERHHATATPYACKFCSESYKSKKCLTQHMSQHLGTQSCRFCEKTFTRRTTLNAHEKMHMGQKTSRRKNPSDSSKSDLTKFYEDFSNQEAGK